MPGLRRLIEVSRRRIAIKLTLTLVGFVAVTLPTAGVYLNRQLEAFAEEALEARLRTSALLLEGEARRLLTGAADVREMDAFVHAAAGPSGARVTLIRTDGIVLADSDVALNDLATLENHAGRPEVRAALAGRVGRHVRQSVTVKAPLLYVAVPVEDRGRVAGVLRLALPLPVVTPSYRALHRMLLFGGLLALPVALVIALVLARRISRPVVEMQAIAHRMSEGDFAARAPVRSSDEIGALGRALNQMALRLRDKIDDFERERTKVAAVLDGMVEGVVAVNGETQIALLNDRARRMFDLGSGAIDGKPLLEVIRNADLHALLHEVHVSGRPVLRREVRVAGPSERLLQANAVPLAFGRGESGVVMVLHDVTELRRLEQMRTEFVANVSHELRTPLTAIQGYMETLLDEDLGSLERRREFLEIVLRHTERLGRLLSDLTDLSNIELGRVQLRIEPMNLADAVDHVLALMHAKAQNAGVNLHANLPSSLPAPHADRDRLVQILVNLVDNGVKYTPPGGSVSVGARETGSNTVEISVTDTGVGIPPEHLPRITERFYRVDKARSREMGGTGLGLAIVKHLVIAHHGDLAIASIPSQGTTVRFTIPIKAPTA